MVVKAHVASVPVWDRVIERIDGLTVYEEDGLLQETMHVLREEVTNLNDQVASTNHERQVAVGNLSKKLGELVAANTNMRGRISQLEAELAAANQYATQGWDIAAQWKARAEGTL